MKNSFLAKLNLSSILFLFFVFCVNNIIAQDLIIKKNNEKIKAKIIEIGTEEVKFRYFDAEDGPIITIKKSEIKTLKIQGKTEKTMEITEDPMSVSNNAIMDKTSSIKFDFFSPLNRHISFSYEWMYKPAFNIEAGFGIIGPGVNFGKGTLSNIYERNPKGAYIRAGTKFLLGNSSDIAIDGAKFAHPLKGRYFKTEIILSSFSTSYEFDTLGIYGSIVNPSADRIKVKSKYQSVAVNLIYGRQFIFGNSITVGYYAGVGYALEGRTSDTPNKYQAYEPLDRVRYSYTYFGEKFPLTATVGFNIGYILKAPEWLTKNSAKQNSSAPSRHSMKEE